MQKSPWELICPINLFTFDSVLSSFYHFSKIEYALSEGYHSVEAIFA